jgi:hypothetical protein
VADGSDLAPARRQSSTLLIAVGVAALLIGSLSLLFEPRWETNDDVGMSMIAHGFGIAAFGTPNLVFSNVVWGHFARAIPSIHGVLGYTTAAYLALIAAGAAIYFAVAHFTANSLAGFAAILLLLCRPVLFPQFTITAGLLTVGALLSLVLYAKTPRRGMLVVGAVLAFGGYLVRSEEFLLVMLVAIPLLPWRTAMRDRSIQVTVAGLCLAIASAATLDHRAYSQPEWKAFKEIRAPLTTTIDFGGAAYLKQHPDILARNGFTRNDIDLVGNWFYAEEGVPDAGALRSMLSDLGAIPVQQGSMERAWGGVKELLHPSLQPLVLAAVLLGLLFPSWRLLACWAMCLGALFSLGLLGRPGVIRVYVPVVSLLVVAPFISQTGSAWRTRLAAVVLIGAALLNSSTAFPAARSHEQIATAVRRGLQQFPSELVVNWGGAFPFEAAYPVFGIPSAAMGYRFYSLGGLSLTPSSHVRVQQSRDEGLVPRLLGPQGVPIIASERRFSLLSTYCKEHWKGELVELGRHVHGEVVISVRRCDRLGPA